MLASDKPYTVAIAFRGSAKTSFAKADILRRICKKENRLIGVVCHQKEVAQSHLFDIAVTLQSNPFIKEDFGQLYYEPTNKQKRSTKKRQDNFITSNGVQLFAASTKTPLRGRQFIDAEGQALRPDYILADDFENTLTKKSPVVTQKVIDFFREMFDGLAPKHKVVFVCNRISNIGSVAWLEGLAEERPSNWDVFEKALIENDDITWPQRYVWTDDEKRQIKEEEDKDVYSIETLRREGVYFNQEYLNIPATVDDEVIRESWLRDSFYTDLQLKEPRYVIHIDPQAGMTESSDEYAITVLAFEKREPLHRFVVDQVCGRGSVLEQVGRFIALCQRYKGQVHKATIEVVLNQTSVYDLAKQWLANKVSLKEWGVDDNDKNVAFAKYKPTTNKEDRVLTQQARFERGEIHLLKSQVELMNQLVYFTSVPHDDRADSLIAAIELSNIATSIKTNYNKVRDTSSSQETIFGNIYQKQF